MPNLGEGEGLVFDLKGYCEGRMVEERDYKDFRFGKDENFIKSEFLRLLEGLSEETRSKLLSVIEANLNFLKQKDVIDYSLLLVFK